MRGTLVILIGVFTPAENSPTIAVAVPHPLVTEKLG
jgi:hypothetical protein